MPGVLSDPEEIIMKLQTAAAIAALSAAMSGGASILKGPNRAIAITCRWQGAY